MRLNQITSPLVRNIITGSATPASDILSVYKDLTKQEAFEARAYFATIDGGSILNHATKERDFMASNDV